MVNFKIYGITTWLTNNSYTDIAQKSEGNQTMKLHQLIESNTINIFIEESYTNCGRGTIPRPFSKKSKLSILLDQ